MAKSFKLNFGMRFGNTLLGSLLKLGLPVGPMFLLSVRGRKSGKEYTTPVTPVEQNGSRWLVSPYGEVNWVRNIRAAGTARLTRSRRTETITVAEASAAEAAPVLKEYLTKASIVRPYFDVAPEASLQDFEAEAPSHPVFRVVSSKTGA
jgi:deazaflavin-dependent oxidoreductase (nitroreductase family)